MAWNAAKPVNSGYLVSADLRSNWAAVADQALGRNLLGDPDFKIWAGGISGNVPSWWNISGQTSDGNIARQESDATSWTIPGNASGVKLTYDSTLELYQNVISTGDLTTSIKKVFDGQAISAGVWIYTDSADCVLTLHGPSSNVRSAAVGASVWTWVTNTVILASSTITRIGMGVELDASGDAYIACPTLVLGPIPPNYYVPPNTARGTVGTMLSGEPVAAATSGTDFDWVYSHNLPFIIERVDVQTITELTTDNLIIDVFQYTDGTTWNSMFSLTSSTTKPQISGTCSMTASGAEPDGAYNYRCFDANSNGATVANTTVGIQVEQAPGEGGKNPTVALRVLSYAPPLQNLRGAGAYK